MTASDSLPPAWEPLTPRGVAAFARAKASRLSLVQFLVTLVVAAAFVWLLYDGCFPAVREAISQMPPEGEIRSGKLNWRGESPQLLAEGRFLAFIVDVDHAGDIRSPAHLQFEFGQDDFQARKTIEDAVVDELGERALGRVMQTGVAVARIVTVVLKTMAREGMQTEGQVEGLRRSP